MKLPSKTIERSLFTEGYRYVIGVDEVGMGCLAGPVVVCAVVLSRNFPDIAGIRDSKLLSEKQREKCVIEIKKHKIRFQISLCYPKIIDKINIYQAARRAMRRAVLKLATKNSIILVDGPHPIASLDLPQKAIVRGDRTVFAIACASIIAKVHRDRMMLRYHKRFPQYGFDQHKGYGTKLHLAMLATHGPTPLHRRSFAPVGRLM